MKLAFKSNDSILEDKKNDKIKELKEDCTEKIENGFKITLDNTLYHFNYTLSKQQNFSDTMRLFENEMIDSIGWNCYINGEKKRVQLDPIEFNNVYLAGVKHKTDALSRLNDTLIPMVEEAESKEVVARIYWDENLPCDTINIEQQNTINKKVNRLKESVETLEKSELNRLLQEG